MTNITPRTWHLSLPCTKTEGEALIDEIPALALFDPQPVIVTSEPDEDRPEEWRLDAYFDEKPSAALLRAIAALVPSAGATNPRATPIAEQDWVTMSQQGIEPLTAGRFHVRTPDYPPAATGIDFVIPAGLAFGTGQHATTRGCLEALDAMKRRGAVVRNLLDLGTGTGLLAFAAMRLWPLADATASDIDPVSIAVVRENAARNAMRPLHLVVADGLAHRDLVRRSPYDLVIANILGIPLIEMAPMIAASVATGGTLLLAGLLDTQADAVARAYRRQGMRLVESSGGEWPVLRMVARR